MIWNGIKRKNWKFCPELLEESCWNPPNPARGWYAVYTFLAEQKINPEELKWSLREGETVVLVLLDIGEFQNKPLDSQALDNIRMILSFFKNYQRDVIFRPVYDREGKGMQHEPDTFKTILTHLCQIGELLAATEHSVFIFQGLLVGSWGEMHTSKYLSEKCLLQMWNCIQPYLEEDICLAVRTPVQWRILVEEREYQKGNFQQTGIFDDGIFGSASHLGTFGTMTREVAGWKRAWNRKEELDFLERITDTFPCGGEVVDSETAGVKEETKWRTVQSILAEMHQMHLSYLNSIYDSRILERWKKQYLEESGIWKGRNLYEYVGAHLGYRFTVKKTEIRLLNFGKVQFRITIENCGFGNLYQKAELFLIMKSKNGLREYPVSVNISEWKSETSKTAEVTVEGMESDIYIRMQRKKDKHPIYFAEQKNTDSLYLGCLCLANI